MINEKESKLNQLLDSVEEIDLSLSYSKLSDFDRNGPMSLIRKSEVNGAGVKHGSLTDDLLVDNMTGSNLFEEKYYKFDGEKPSASLGTLCDIILKNYVEMPKDINVILIIVKLNKLWSNIKDENTLIKKFDIDEFWDYMNTMYEIGDRQIVTTQDYNDAIEAVSILKSHKFSKHILINNFENIYQYKFEIEYFGFKFRGILDLISIDHNKKEIYFTDLKTGKAPASEFEDSFIKWRYYFQEGIYRMAFNRIAYDLKLSDYKLKPFQFLYISKTEKIPFLFKVTEKWSKAAFTGFSIGRYNYRGIDEIIDEIYWCWKNKEYVVPKYISDRNGVVDLKDNFIELNE